MNMTCSSTSDFGPSSVPHSTSIFGPVLSTHGGYSAFGMSNLPSIYNSGNNSEGGHGSVSFSMGEDGSLGGKGGGGMFERGDREIHSTTLNISGGSHSHSDDSDNDSTRLPSQSDDTYPTLTRKKRRGIIEKRRRDRINTALEELRRLVPSAFEKQGSQKIEKADILQMTVEHLRILQSRGLDSLLADPQQRSSDYHSMGFRECASEVAKYLSSFEGMDLQDPLHMRLMSHLQCYSAQRAAAMKSALNAAAVAAYGGRPTGPTQWGGYGSNPMLTPQSMGATPSYPGFPTPPHPSPQTPTAIISGMQHQERSPPSAFAPTALIPTPPVSSLHSSGTVTQMMSMSQGQFGMVPCSVSTVPSHSSQFPTSQTQFGTSQSIFPVLTKTEDSEQKPGFGSKSWHPNTTCASNMSDTSY